MRAAGGVFSTEFEGVFAPIVAQFERLEFSESARAMRIASAYGDRLNINGMNLKSAKSMENLVSGYADHGFSIDRHEAEDLFNNVSVDAKDYLRDDFNVSFTTGTDNLYIGLYKPFNSFYVEFTSVADAAVSLNYSIAGSSIPDLDDDTKNFSRNGFITFNKPNNWVEQSFGGVTAGPLPGVAHGVLQPYRQGSGADRTASERCGQRSGSP